MTVESRGRKEGGTARRIYPSAGLWKNLCLFLRKRCMDTAIASWPCAVERSDKAAIGHCRHKFDQIRLDCTVTVTLTPISLF